MSKKMIKDALYDYLYKPVQNHYESKLHSIINRNTILLKSGSKHFVYKGITYSTEEDKLPLLKQRLDTSFYKEMDSYLADLSNLNNNELPYVLGFINQVLNSSESLKDYLMLLPEAATNPIKNMECPCKARILPEEIIDGIKAKNTKAVNLIKQRLALNLLM